MFGCIDMGSEPKEVPPDGSSVFADDIQPIFDISCALSGCHVSSALRPPDLRDGQSYLEIVDVESSGFAPLKLVKPTKPEESVIYLKILGDQSTGSRMPPGGTLSDASILAIRTWIEAGAKNN
tara:strand:+ start:6877 stop:7245 length:369 start_codon:yes stop_codon:yes gene_type:complete